MPAHYQSVRQSDIVTTFRYVEKKRLRQGDVIPNVIMGICKQKGCMCGNTVITKLQFFWGVKSWAFCSVEISRVGWAYRLWRKCR